MPQVQLPRLQSLFIKVEATEGTDAVPAAGDAIQLIEPATINFGAEIINDRPDLHNQSLDEAGPAPPAGKFVSIDGKMWLRGLGSAYSAPRAGQPEVDPILQAIGMSSTGSFVGGSESYIYDTLSAVMKTVTAYGFQGLETGVWVKHVLLAGRVDKATFAFKAGKPVELAFTLKGLFVTPADAATITPIYQSQTCPNWGTGTTGFALGGFAGVPRTADLMIDNKLTPRLSGNGPTDSLVGYLQGRRIITLDAKYEAMRIADIDAFTKWATSVQDALVLKMPGGTGTQYKRMTISADRTTILDAPTYQKDGDLWLQGIKAKCSPEGTNRCQVKFD